jgi:tryptophan synthase alpha chain
VTPDAISRALTPPPDGPVHLVPFLPGGYGGVKATAESMRAVAEAGASVIELGIPFSDPIADGPTIQAAYHEALRSGTTVDAVLAANAEAAVAVPTLVMVSYSIVRRRGERRFCESARSAGVSGILCPDLPTKEGEAFADVARTAGLAPVLLVSPATPAARRDTIGTAGGGFVYYQSVAGTTGERDTLPPELAAGVADMRDRTDLPIAVGFGISRKRHLEALHGTAEAAIVGSAFVRRMKAALDADSDPAAACGELTRTLLGRD